MCLQLCRLRGTLLIGGGTRNSPTGCGSPGCRLPFLGMQCCEIGRSRDLNDLKPKAQAEKDFQESYRLRLAGPLPTRGSLLALNQEPSTSRSILGGPTGTVTPVDLLWCDPNLDTCEARGNWWVSLWASLWRS